MRQLFTLTLLATLLLFFSGSMARGESAKKLNVLLLMADDWRPELGCYGVAGMKTPNLDRLAETGVRFERAYCQFSVCNASRTSMLTGRYPNATGVVFNGTPLRDLHPDWITLPQFFRQQGYVTATAGKIFHGRFPDPPSWTESIAEHVPAEFRRRGQSQPKDDGEGGGPAGVKYVVLEGNGESDRDYHIASDGIQLLEKYGKKSETGQPFFITVGFHRPHAIPTAPKRFYDLYDVNTIPLAPDFAPRPTVPAGAPAVALPDENDTYMTGDTSPQAAWEVLRAYRASASWTDWNMGRVLDALERLGLAENTIVVFTSDHGYHNGEKGRWGKNTVFEIALRVPLMIRLPGAAGNGQVCTRPVQLLDLYPTLADLCGLPEPPDIVGHRLAPLLKDTKADWPWPACSMAKSGGGPIGYSIRTERWHYAEWKGGDGGAMLFDPAADPHEMHNLVGDSQHAPVVAELKAEMAKTFGPMPHRITAPRKTTTQLDNSKPHETNNVMWRFDGNGRFPNIRPPHEWDANKNVLWKTPIEIGAYSSPIVVGDKVFVTAEMGSLICLDLKDGKVRWQKDLFGKESRDIPEELSKKLMRGCGGDSKQSTPTPTSNGELVFYINAMGLCACYDLQGNQKWIQIVETAEDEEHFSSSPIFVGHRIILSWGCLLALDAKDGRTLWKAEDALPTHGTPAITKVGGEEVAITPAGDIVKLADGEILCSGLFDSTFTTPLVEGNVVYLIDSDSVALELPAKAVKGMKPKELWRTELSGEFMASPVYHDGLLYTIEGERCRLHILDAKNGEVLTVTRSVDEATKSEFTEPGVKVDGLKRAKYVYASPAVTDKNVFFFDDAGNTAVLEPGRQYKLARINKLEESFVGTPFFINDKIIIRGSQCVYCIGEKHE